MDINNPFYQEVLENLSKNEVEFMLVGGFAVGYYGYHRYTGDMDLWLNPTEENLEKLYKALEHDLDFDKGSVDSIRKNREIDNQTPIKLVSDDGSFKVDLMTNIFQEQFKWKDCRSQCRKFEINKELTVPVVHINHLIRIKENSSRLDKGMKDLVDAQELKKIQALENKEKDPGKKPGKWKGFGF
tara:strand:+ start:1597 stop:2151 length:555 start_codon:yes stop_codon:yes gene_type:complete